jgi:methionyl-tRNA synthetase
MSKDYDAWKEAMKEPSHFITRFAPSPNGWLHLGHAYSALLGAHYAKAARGRISSTAFTKTLRGWG